MKTFFLSTSECSTHYFYLNDITQPNSINTKQLFRYNHILIVSLCSTKKTNGISWEKLCVLTCGIRACVNEIYRVEKIICVGVRVGNVMVLVMLVVPVLVLAMIPLLYSWRHQWCVRFSTFAALKLDFLLEISFFFFLYTQLHKNPKNRSLIFLHACYLLKKNIKFKKHKQPKMIILYAL